MTVKLLYDYIDPIEGVIPNLETIFGKPTYKPFWEYLDKKIYPSFLGSDHKNWFYPIHVDRTTHYVDEFIISPGRYEKHSHFLNKVPKKVKDSLYTNNGHFLIYFYEPMSKAYVDALVSVINKGSVTTYFSGDVIPYEKFLIVPTGHVVDHPNFLNFPSPHMFDIKNFIAGVDFRNFSNFPESDDATINEQQVNKRKSFYCLNARHFKSSHRLNILRLLEKTKLIENGYVSAKGFNNLYSTFREDIAKYSDINLVIESEQEFGANPWDCNSLQTVTEKTYRNFLHKKPFLIFSQPGHLKKIKELGFKTFDQIFDESYDFEVSTSKRMMLIVKELFRWTNLSNDERDTQLQKVESTLTFNFNLMNKRMEPSYLEKTIMEFKNGT